MKERINRLARGILDMESLQLAEIPEKIADTVQTGKTESRGFYVNSANNLHIKGLVYTNNTRITIETPSFGGTRNRIGYQIYANYLEEGDTICGEFELVTNAGERKIPFVFTVQPGMSGETLAGLKTAEDFAASAQKNQETALRLFDYQDFVQTQFMQDMHIRAVYDSLKGYGDRRNQMEEFLLSVTTKEPVSFKTSTKQRTYPYPSEPINDVIEVQVSSWGDFSMQIQADGSFLELPKKHADSREVRENILSIPYRIVKERLHRGKNFGRICLSTAKETMAIPIKVEGQKNTELSRIRRYRKSLGTFMALRLDAACRPENALSLHGRMVQELDVMKSEEKEDTQSSLWMAEIFLLAGKKEQAAAELENCRNKVIAERREQLERYCFFQYLHQQIQPNIYQKETLLRLIKKYLLTDQCSFLFFVRLELDDTIAETPLTLLTEMRELYEEGFHSPFLFFKAYSLLQEHPDFLENTGEFLFQVLNFASKKEIIGEEMAVNISEAAYSEKDCHPLLLKTLIRLFARYSRKEILGSICMMMIKGDCRKASDFHWYSLALERGVRLPRLFEYYLYTLPKDYHQLLPKEILLYFSYGHDLDSQNKAVLYQNVLQYMDSSAKLYSVYERDIEEFAVEQVFASAVDRNLAVIYSHIIFKEMLDEPVAKILPDILRSYHISCQNLRMTHVVIRYEELTGEKIYPLINHEAYVPLFSETAVIVFQDGAGNRYADILYQKTPLMNKPDLEKQCFILYPKHPLLSLAACKEIVSNDSMNSTKVDILAHALDELPLTPLFRENVLSKIISYYQKQAEEMDRLLEEGEAEGREKTEAQEQIRSQCAYLLTLDAQSMSHRERVSVCETLISQNYLEEAYGMLKEYGWEGIEGKKLTKLCSKTILQKLFDKDVFLLKLSSQVFSQGRADSVLLDYLCEHYNGNSDQMFKLLTQAVSARVETYDLEERLLCQMMFSGSMEYLDRTFQFYTKKKRMSETVVKAYFTIKSISYFLKHEVAQESVFSYLEAAVNQAEGMEKVPVIYLLALTKYYSECELLEEDQKLLCQKMSDYLIEEELIFPYTKKLARFISVPQDILDKAMISYEGKKTDKPQLMVRILPDEQEYHLEEMKRIYQGIFGCRKVLFEGESLSYQIYLPDSDGKKKKKEEGIIDCELAPSKLKESRFSSLNDMELCLSMKEEAGLKKNMQEYLIKNVTLEELFPVVP